MMNALERLTWVEDEPDIREIAAIALADVGGFELDLCASGQEALQRTPAFRPQLIVLDVMMPDMDGLVTLQRLREIPELADTPVIFLTARALAWEVRHFRALGAAEVITKPFDPMALPQQLAAIWRRAQASPSRFARLGHR